ncbi:hypothetical protein M426DRAFT_319758 [Hypoxylon sp. CI-4A]|nr:hypothetical protein M426DRAFT_319758 [Hypoxylon sp. CI-4A]
MSSSYHYDQYCGICHGQVQPLLCDLTPERNRTDVSLTSYGGFSRSFSSEPDELSMKLHDDADRTIVFQRPGYRYNDNEYVRFHHDCFLLLYRRYKSKDILQRLWVFAIWRTPWVFGPSAFPEESITIPGVAKAADNMFPGLKMLPLEILSIIKTYSQDSLFWRYSSVLGLANQFSSLVSNEVEASTPLRKISRWERGSPIEAVTSPQYPYIRLTLDELGVTLVERLPAFPTYETWQSTRLVYVIVHEKDIEGVIAHIKFGTLRLELPRKCPGFHSWKTPTPVPDERCVYFSVPTPPTSCLHWAPSRTIDLHETTGITFIFVDREIWYIHNHSVTTPMSTDVIQRFPHLENAVWIYVPIPPDDSVIAIGPIPDQTLVIPECYLFRMRLAGDVLVGHIDIEQETPDIHLTTAPPTKFIYNATGWQRISVTGVVLEDSGQNREFSPLRYPWRRGLLNRGFCSMAPFIDVARIQVFHTEEITCRGILLSYKDGSQRALGECRIGVDSVTDCANPKRLCVRTMCLDGVDELHHPWDFEVRSNNGPEHDHEELYWSEYHYDGWFCLQEGDIIHWEMYNVYESYISIHREHSSPNLSRFRRILH